MRPPSQSPRNVTCYLGRFVTSGRGSEGLAEFTLPGNDFLLLTYKTTEARSKAKKHLLEEFFRYDGQKVDLRIEVSINNVKRVGSYWLQLSMPVRLRQQRQR